MPRRVSFVGMVVVSGLIRDSIFLALFPLRIPCEASGARSTVIFLEQPSLWGPSRENGVLLALSIAATMDC